VFALKDIPGFKNENSLIPFDHAKGKDTQYFFDFDNFLMADK